MADLNGDPAIEIPFSDPDPVPDPIDDQKDVYRGITNVEAKDRMLDVSKELDQDLEEVSSSGIYNGSEVDHRTSIHDEEALTDSNFKHDHSEAVVSNQDKVLKKPDKILPCPRCNSLNTKFCYYNNYNVNQPRNFCKNCQRYWTAGGTMRNVPVGAGRRKTKHSLQQQTHFGSVSAPVGNEVVMKFGAETPLCKSMASVLKPGGQKRSAEMVFVSGGQNDKEPPCSSFVTPTCAENNLSSVTPNCPENDFSKLEDHKEQLSSPGYRTELHPMHLLQGFPGPPWPYSWGPAWNNDTAMAASHCSSDNSIPNPVLWCPPVILAATAMCAPPIPFPILPASYWPCMSSWPNQAWSVPCRGPINGLSSSSPVTNNESSGNDSPTLGKHSRDGSFQGEEKIEKKLLWVPKTLRIDDPKEAAKSSIWSTLGIRPDESIKRGSLFRGFHANNESSGYASNAAQVLRSNPAALARSQTFQEST